MATQTDLVIVNREVPVINFLETEETCLEDTNIPNCFHFVSSRLPIKSPKIPVGVEGIRVPMVLDTGAEVSVLPLSFFDRIFKGEKPPEPLTDVRSMGGTLVRLRGPVRLRVDVCDISLSHSFYFHDDSPMFLMGYDLISAAALVIDPANRCVWSRYSPSVVSSQSVQSESNDESTQCVDASVGTSSFSNDSVIYVTPLSKRPITDLPCCISPGPSADFPFSGPSAEVPLIGPRADCGPRAVSSSPPSFHHGQDRFRSSSSPSSVSDVSLTDVPLVPSRLTSLPPSEDPVVDDPEVGLADSGIGEPGVFDFSDALPNLFETSVKEIFDQEPPDKLELPEHVNLLFIQTVRENNLASEVVQDLKELLYDHKETFAASSTDLGFCPILKHDIDTGDSRPIKQSPRKPPFAAREAEDQILNEMLEVGVIEPSSSPWASPVCLVKKKDDTYRFCVDYRRVNAVSRKDAYPLPDIQDALDNLRGSCYFATIDLLSGYWQLGMTDRAKERSAFCTRRGLFQFTRMPFGLSGAPGSFCRLMGIILRDLLWVICLCYLDDIVVYAKTPQELLERLRKLLDRLRHVGLKVKPSKCELFKTEIKFLGHQVSVHGIEPMPDKIEAIREWPTPRCLRDVRAFFGLASYYRRFVKGFATIAEPLTRLTRKQARFEWGDEAQGAFDSLKQALMDASSLAFPYPDRPCIVDTDASDVAVGAVLSQSVDGLERPIAFFSRVMNSAQRNYCATRREMLAVISALQHFRHYLLGTKVILRTDHHSLKWLKTFKRPEGILARWVETLAEFDFEIEHRPGLLHSNSDGLSRPFCKQCMDKPVKSVWADELERADESSGPLTFNSHLGPSDIHVDALELVSEIGDEEMAELQAEDPELGPVMQWLCDNEDPPPDFVKSLSPNTRRIWAQVPIIGLENGVLNRQKSIDGPLQLVVPQSLRKRLFLMTHAGPLAAHLGAARTILQMKDKYYWPCMNSDITSWCRECHECAKSKGPPTKHKGPLQKVITGAPLDIVAVDILSGVPVTPEGEKHLLVLTDYFTKWATAFALPDAEASTCMRAMYNGFFAIFGLPRQIHTDLGKNFESKLFHELCKLTGVEKTHTTAFHPQSDGQTERFNRTLLQMLRTTADENPHSWPQRLHTVLSAYRMTVHSVTGITPNMAMLGREVLMPATLIAKPPEESITITVPFVSDLRDTLRAAHEKVRQNTRKFAKTEKRYYDSRTKPVEFAVGQQVWLYWPKPKDVQKFKKLNRYWTGPWTIIAIKSDVNVEIEHMKIKDPRHGKLKRQIVHIDRLTPCKISSDITSPEEVVEPDTQVTDSMEGDSQTEIQDILTDTTSSRPIRTKRIPKSLENYILRCCLDC